MSSRTKLTVIEELILMLKFLVACRYSAQVPTTVKLVDGPIVISSAVIEHGSMLL